MFGYVKTATYWIHLFHALQNHHESHHIIVVHPGAKVHQHGPVTEDLNDQQLLQLEEFGNFRREFEQAVVCAPCDSCSKYIQKKKTKLRFYI